MDPLLAGVFLAGCNTALIDYLFAPVKAKFPQVDFWWLLYVALASGAALAWLANLNMFSAYVADAVTGRVLTCLFVGGGSKLIHDVFDQKTPATARSAAKNG